MSRVTDSVSLTCGCFWRSEPRSGTATAVRNSNEEREEFLRPADTVFAEKLKDTKPLSERKVIQTTRPATQSRPLVDMLAAIPFDLGTGVVSNHQFIVIDERPIVAADIDGMRIPFYLSTGYGGKKDVPAGKWYPFFGIDTYDGVTFLKAMDQGAIKAYYGSEKLKDIATRLDKEIGDIRNLTDLPELDLQMADSIKASARTTIDFLNRDMPFVNLAHNIIQNGIKEIVTKLEADR